MKNKYKDDKISIIFVMCNFDLNEIQEILKKIHNKNFIDAIKKIEQILKRFPNIDIVEWKKQIEIYEKLSGNTVEKFKIYTNIGVVLFKIGKINKSIDAFKASIQIKPNFSLAYNNLAISYLEIGKFEKASENFALALKINKEDTNAQKNLINIFNIIQPKNDKENSLINLNYQIHQITKNLKIKNYYDTESIKKILNEGSRLIDNTKKNLSINETQIFRKNSKNLNCFRHFKVFNEFNVIPKYCFSCYKIQINLFRIVDLIKLYFIFDKNYFENNNMRKCMVETREQIKGNYKGYIYCTSIAESKDLKEYVEKKMCDEGFKNYKITIKHGCSEFYKSYPDFEKINYKGDQIMKYDESWFSKEEIIDKRIPIRNDKDKKIWGSYVNGLNLSDVLIINNWMNYADLLGDYSYKKIYEGKINPNFINKVLENQIDFRIKNF